MAPIFGGNQPDFAGGVMNIFRKPRPQNLADWLEIATAELAPSAQDRICMDIASHYYEAVDEHERKGLSLSASKGAALAELGDAKAAARHFRRSHLTLREFWKVCALLKLASLNWGGTLCASGL
jgi:hypothetical protein